MKTHNGKLDMCAITLMVHNNETCEATKMQQSQVGCKQIDPAKLSGHIIHLITPREANIEALGKHVLDRGWLHPHERYLH